MMVNTRQVQSDTKGSICIIWKEIAVPTNSRVEFIDITARIDDWLSHSNVKNGACYVYVPHTTAGVTINENADPDVVTDMINGLEKIAPLKGNYLHAEGNSDAHIKASLIGFSQIVPVIDGKLALGTWQGIYFCEFDGPRRRKLLIGTAKD